MRQLLPVFQGRTRNGTLLEKVPPGVTTSTVSAGRARRYGGEDERVRNFREDGRGPVEGDTC